MTPASPGFAGPHGLAGVLAALPSRYTVYGLALLAAAVWGAAPVTMKRGLDAGARPRQAVAVVLAADAATVWAALVALHGSATLSRVVALDPRLLGLFVATGVFGTALGRLVGLVGLDRLGASVYSAALSVRPLFAAALGVGLLGERLNALQLGGVVVLVAGLVVLERAREHGGGERGGWRRRDLALPTLAAAAYAGSRVLRRFGLKAGTVDPLAAVAVNEVAGLVVLCAALLAWHGREVFVVPREALLPLLASGVLVAVGMVASFTALASPAGRVVVVDPLVATVPLFTVAYAAAWLETERVTPRVVAGAALVVVGAALVVLR